MNTISCERPHMNSGIHEGHGFRRIGLPFLGYCSSGLPGIASRPLQVLGVVFHFLPAAVHLYALLALAEAESKELDSASRA